MIRFNYQLNIMSVGGGERSGMALYLPLSVTFSPSSLLFLCGSVPYLDVAMDHFELRCHAFPIFFFKQSTSSM